VAGERVKLPVAQRTKLGSAESRRLRKQGVVPGVLYGRNEPVAISVGERELRAALTTPAGTHAVLDVAIDGGSEHSAILKEYQRDRIRGTITHIDLQEVRLDQPIHAAVAVHLVGEAIGAKEGGVLSQVTIEVHVEALPLEVPQHLEADVSELHIGGSIRIGELQIPDGVTLLDDPETVLATVTTPTREIEPEVEEAAEGEEGAEGEAPEAAAEGEEPAAEGGEPAESGAE
jgi:large subunit ribosomal protein L25